MLEWTGHLIVTLKHILCAHVCKVSKNVSVLASNVSVSVRTLNIGLGLVSVSASTSHLHSWFNQPISMFLPGKNNPTKLLKLTRNTALLQFYRSFLDWRLDRVESVEYKMSCNCPEGDTLECDLVRVNRSLHYPEHPWSWGATDVINVSFSCIQSLVCIIRVFFFLTYRCATLVTRRLTLKIEKAFSTSLHL